MKDRIIKGIRKPRNILPYILNRLPGRKSWFKMESGVSFDFGHFQASPDNLAEYHAKLYYEVKGIRDFVGSNCDIPFDRSLEIGSGYGRLSPFLSEMSREHHAIEPNKNAFKEAEKHYPHIDFKQRPAQEIPYETDSFDFIFTWNVLMHIPPKDLTNAIEEIQRVLQKNGHLLVMENTTNNNSEMMWGRSKEKYQDLLGMDMVDCEERPVEVTYKFEKSSDFRAEDNHMMLFHNK